MNSQLDAIYKIRKQLDVGWETTFRPLHYTMDGIMYNKLNHIYKSLGRILLEKEKIQRWR